MKIIVTQDLLNQYPHLIDSGVEVGQEIDSSEYGVTLEETPSNDQNLDEDPGGNNPPKKPNLP